MNKITKSERREIDRLVGQQLRHIRNFRDMSQEKLGKKIDLTFQQLQKYENGANRMSASVLYALSHILKVKIECFFEGMEEVMPEPMPTLNKKHYELIRLYEAAPKDVREDFVNILKAVGDKE